MISLSVNQPMFIIHVDFIPDTATVSLHSSWYWSDWPASQSLCESAPCSCKKTRMFSAHNNWFLYSAGKSTGTTGYISSSYFRYGLMVLFPAMRRKSAVIGTCTIPERVSKVRIKTTGLQAYFYNVNIPLRRSRLSGKMETTCPDRRKPL